MMITYKLLLENGEPHNMVYRSDGYYIPFDKDNTDYQKFLDDINEQGPSVVDGVLTEFILTDAANKKFNYQLSQYATAIVRLAERDLSVTVPAVVSETVIGYQHNDTTGVSEPVVDTVVITPEIPAIPATIIVDDEEIANPILVKDQEERAAAQAIIAATPPDVVTAYENSLET
jgi:hypothetical protein